MLLLASQGVESPRIAAQGPSVIDGTLEVEYEDSYAGARLTHYLNTGTERLAPGTRRESRRCSTHLRHFRPA